MSWWLAGGALMPLIGFVGLVLYYVLAERAVVMYRNQPGTCTELELTRGLWLARILCAALPLLGLIGTVTGISGSFSALANDQDGLRLVGAGVSMALISTQYALALAIPGLIGESWLRGQAQRLALAQKTP